MMDADDDEDEIMSVEEFAGYSDDDDFIQEVSLYADQGHSTHWRSRVVIPCSLA